MNQPEPSPSASSLPSEARRDLAVDESGETRRASVAARAAVPRDARKKARARRWAARALVVATPIALVLYDFTRRRARIVDFEPGELAFYFGSAAVGVVLWTCLLLAASRARGVGRWPLRVLLAISALLCVGSQLYTFARYGAYMNHRAVLVGTSFLPSIGQQLWFDRWTFLRSLLPSLAIAIAVPALASRLAPMRRRARAWLCLDVALVATLTAMFVSPQRGAEQGQPPDVMYVSAMGQLMRARWDHNETVERVHPGQRSPEPVPAFVARPSRPRNVVMVITESVRAQSVCVEYTPDCKFTPFSNAAAKDRIPLTQMRALDSTTAISLAVMWNGLLPTSDRKDQHTAPILWEYAHAAGLETAYYTSQNLLFGNSGLWLEGQPWTRHVSATQIEQDATYEVGADDGKLVDHVIGDVGALKEPWLAVVHLSNTHFPYKIDPDDMPFTPQEEATGPGYENEILNRYLDAIHMQDKAVGRLLRALRARPEADRTVVVYVSDHGEQMREKGAVGHTGTLFDPEIRIPFWVDAPPATLTDAERTSLRSLEATPVTHLDVFPTIMDLLGFWDAPELSALRARVAGQSLLRGGSAVDRAIAMTNCSELWACAFKNWGAIKGTKKLIAHQGDSAWNCYDVGSDPREEHRLDLAECAELLPLAEGTSAGKRPF
ncbi:MAG: sulfatase-like hydrolase/transferase [Labilithrix sp.]|nr:sulfatase-like hydrolase/transferase [Labilithrix sp.]